MNGSNQPVIIRPGSSSPLPHCHARVLESSGTHNTVEDRESPCFVYRTYLGLYSIMRSPAGPLVEITTIFSVRIEKSSSSRVLFMYKSALSITARISFGGGKGGGGAMHVYI